MSMGGFTMSNAPLLEHFTEVVGYKSGLVLARDRLLAMIGEHSTEAAASLADGDGATHLDSVEHEELVAFLLFKVGVLSSPRAGFPSSDVYHRFQGDALAAPLVEPIGEKFYAYLETEMADLSPGDAEGVNPWLVEIHGAYGDHGADVALAHLRAMLQYQLRQPSAHFRHREWRDSRDLDDLFASENLRTPHGRFFDQRFIDYLARNFDDLDQIHWRQFEAMAAEHFDRQGFRVELGPGRADGGVDIRVYPTTPDPDLPPLILVQCKRQRAKVASAVVKTLYADMAWEGAGSGLIVTSSELSRDARRVCRARSYRVAAAERPNLRTWIEAMRRAPL
jgi:restriction system protein